MALVIELDANGVPDPDTKRQRPSWLNENGLPLTDAEFVERGVYPLVYERPELDPLKEEVVIDDPSQWTVGDTQVTATAHLSTFPLDKVRDNVLGRIGTLREKVETSGMLFTDSNGTTHVFGTSDEAQGKIMAERQAVDIGARVDGEKWRTDHGFVSFSNADIKSAWATMREHVRQAFQRESELEALANDTTRDTADKIVDVVTTDAKTGWHSNAVWTP